MAAETPVPPPPSSNRMPPGIPYIVGNEAAERFCYYGINGILVVFMTQYLLNGAGQRATLSNTDAEGWYHVFVSAVYYLPILGAILADAILGKYRTILYSLAGLLPGLRGLWQPTARDGDWPLGWG